MKRKNPQAGSLLIITLWMVAILSTFAIAIARYMSVELRVMRYRAARAQARVMARSGVYVAMARLKADAGTYDWLGDPAWALVQGDGLDPSRQWELQGSNAKVNPIGELTQGSRLMVKITDEESKVPINKLSEAVPDAVVLAAIRNLFSSDLLAAKVVDYADTNTDPCLPAVCGAEGSERDDAVAPPYVAKNAALKSCAELLTIPGISVIPFNDLKTLCGELSFYAEKSKINVNTVSKEVLTGLGINAALPAILEYQSKDDATFQHGSAALTELITQLTTDVWQTQAVRDIEKPIIEYMDVASQVFQVESTGESALSMGKKQTAIAAHVQAVVRRKDCGEGMPEPCILAWNEW